MDFFIQTGKLAMGSRLRRLGERFMMEAEKIYAMYGVDLNPRWFPVFYVLSQGEALSTTEIARLIGQTHASVSQVIQAMRRKGVVETTKSPADARTNAIRLSDKGRETLEKLQVQLIDVENAAETLLSEAQYNLWKAIEEMEFLLDQQDFFSRVRQIRKERERQAVEIIAYKPEHAAAFAAINYAWIEQYFEIEAADRAYLDHPEEKILKPGGHIFMARYQGEIVGTCALVRKDNKTFELAKMGVKESARGKHIGWLLGKASLEKAKALGAEKVCLESNTALAPAIRLYHKLGFEKVTGPPSPYSRCNIQMEVVL